MDPADERYGEEVDACGREHGECLAGVAQPF
jgi:hypothetical protein